MLYPLQRSQALRPLEETIFHFTHQVNVEVVVNSGVHNFKVHEIEPLLLFQLVPHFLHESWDLDTRRSLLDNLIYGALEL